MKRFFINESEKKRIRSLYESKGIVLNEEHWVGLLARGARRFIGKNSDEISNALKTSERALMTSLDDILSVAAKNKNVQTAEDIQIKLMHIFNPSGSPAGVNAAKEQVKNFLNGYAKSKGKQNWVVIKNDIKGIKTTQTASATSQAVNQYAGKKITSDAFRGKEQYIDFSKFDSPSYWASSSLPSKLYQLNQDIARALKYGNFNYIPTKGFEKFGIPNLREFLQKNIEKVEYVDIQWGIWRVIFKK